MSSTPYWLIIVLVFTLSKNVESRDSWFQIDDEDGKLAVPDLIRKYGYQVKNHSVTTEDGYELTMFRISPKQTPSARKLPILMVHGLLGCSADFIIIGPNNSLAYLLSDNGHEVWLANVRGTRYSRKHLKLSTDSKEYWNFSWHEIGLYDLPAMIDYIINATKVNQVNYIGFSQGTTTYFVMTSTRPLYNNKIARMVALSPATFLKQVRSPLIKAAIPLFGAFKKLMDWQGIYEILPHHVLSNLVVGTICTSSDPESLCPNMIGQVAGPDPESYDKMAVAAYSGHYPAGASVKQFAHYMQLMRSGFFRRYNNGKVGNMRAYGSEDPPFYNLTASTAPVSIYYGLNDWVVHPQGVRDFAKKLPQVISVKPVEDKKFNHLDFILAKKVRSLIYDEVIRTLNAITP